MWKCSNARNRFIFGNPDCNLSFLGSTTMDFVRSYRLTQATDSPFLVSATWRCLEPASAWLPEAQPWWCLSQQCLLGLGVSPFETIEGMFSKVEWSMVVLLKALLVKKLSLAFMLFRVLLSSVPIMWSLRETASPWSLCSNLPKF